MKRLRRFWAFVICLGLAWTWVIPVQAHAGLVRSDPPANAALAQSPGQIDLFFSEAVDARLSKIQVIDSKGNQVDHGPLHTGQADGMCLSASLPPLPNGVYLVAWEIVSATDGHQTAGSFPFAVGEAAPAAMAGMSNPETPAAPVDAMIVKGLLYLGAAALMGRSLFVIWVWEPARRAAGIPEQDLPVEPRFFRTLATGALSLLVAADLLALLLQAGQDAGSGIGWPWQPTFWIVASTRVGVLALVRLGLAGLLAGLVLPRPNGWNRWAGMLAGAMLLLTFSLESHAAADPAPALPLLADWAHMLAVSIWVGGLFSFLLGMWMIRILPAGPRTNLTAFLIPRFTNLALISVAVLVVSGVYAAALRLGGLDALWSTPYGQALALKLILALPMLGLGAVNFLYTSPNMRRAAAQPGGNPAQVARFGRLLAGEVVFGVILLVWVGVFTSLAPAHVPGVQPGYQAATQADDLRVSLTVDPAQPGINTFTAKVTSNGLPLLNAQEVELEISPLSGMIPPAKALMNPAGPGVFTLSGGYLAMPEKWDVKVVVIRSDKFDAYADFKIDLSQGASQAMVGK